MRHREKEHKIQNREGVCKITSFQINNKPLWSFSCFCLGNSCHQRQSVRGKKKKIPAVQAKKKEDIECRVSSLHPHDWIFTERDTSKVLGGKKNAFISFFPSDYLLCSCLLGFLERSTFVKEDLSSALEVITKSILDNTSRASRYLLFFPLSDLSRQMTFFSLCSAHIFSFEYRKLGFFCGSGGSTQIYKTSFQSWLLHQSKRVN